MARPACGSSRFGDRLLRRDDCARCDGRFASAVRVDRRPQAPIARGCAPRSAQLARACSSQLWLTMLASTARALAPAPAPAIDAGDRREDAYAIHVPADPNGLAY